MQDKSGLRPLQNRLSPTKSCTSHKHSGLSLNQYRIAPPCPDLNLTHYSHIKIQKK